MPEEAEIEETEWKTYEVTIQFVVEAENLEHAEEEARTYLHDNDVHMEIQEEGATGEAQR